MSEQIILRYEVAKVIAYNLKENIRTIDRELKRSRETSLGEAAIVVLQDKRKTLRAVYEQVKQAIRHAGREIDDTTLQNW